MKKFEVYFCPICGRTVTHEVNPDTLPNITCGPHEDEVTGAFMVCMAQIFPREEDDPAGKLNKEITDNHKARHKLLHKMLDELVSDLIRHTEKLPSKTTVLELMKWSSEQIDKPTEEA